VRLIDFYEDAIEELHAACAGDGEEGADAGGGGAAAPPLAGSRERAQADLASLCRQVRELRRRSALAAAAAAQLGLELVVSYHSHDFAEAQDAQRSLAAAGALCGAAGDAAVDAEVCLAGIDPDLPGLLATSELWPRLIVHRCVHVSVAPLTRRRFRRILNQSPPRAGLAGPPGLRPRGFLHSEDQSSIACCGGTC